MRSTEACYINVTYLNQMGYELPDKLTWDFVWEVSDKAAEKDENGEDVLETIEDDDEFEKVAEIFEDMKATDAPAELLAELKELFERADFVKFAKFVASDEDNAAALPLAVRFVTSSISTAETSVRTVA